MKWLIVLFMLTSHSLYIPVVIKPVTLEEVVVTYYKPSIVNVYNYVLSKTDSLNALRLTAICINETGLVKGKRFNNNNLCCIRTGNCKKNIGFDNSEYGIYENWQDSIDDLIEYEKKYGKKSWYNRFYDKILISSKRVKHEIKKQKFN